MNTLKSFIFSAWIDGRDNTSNERCMISWRANDSSPGMPGCSFYFSQKEIEDIAFGRTAQAADGHYKLEVWGDVWNFYHLEIPRLDAGIAQVPYRRITIPIFIVRMLLKKARQIWKAQKQVSEDKRYFLPRVEITLSKKQREKYVRLYGQGTGNVDWTISDHAKDEFRVDSENIKFVERLDYLARIARNSTRGFFHTAKILIHRDGDSYTWDAQTPRGRTILWGGLIRRENGEWSIHT